MFHSTWHLAPGRAPGPPVPGAEWRSESAVGLRHSEGPDEHTGRPNPRHHLHGLVREPSGQQHPTPTRTPEIARFQEQSSWEGFQVLRWPSPASDRTAPFPGTKSRSRPREGSSS